METSTIFLFVLPRWLDLRLDCFCSSNLALVSIDIHLNPEFSTIFVSNLKKKQLIYILYVLININNNTTVKESKSLKEKRTSTEHMPMPVVMIIYRS